MKKALTSLLVVLLAGIFTAGCTEKPMKGISDPGSARVGNDVGVMDGALITHEIEKGEVKNPAFVSNAPIIVECPSCNQRVDVTGLPKDRIRCPNCNSLFTY